VKCSVIIRLQLLAIENHIYHLNSYYLTKDIFWWVSVKKHFMEQSNLYSLIPKGLLWFRTIPTKKCKLYISDYTLFSIGLWGQDATTNSSVEVWFLSNYIKPRFKPCDGKCLPIMELLIMELRVKHRMRWNGTRDEVRSKKVNWISFSSQLALRAATAQK